MAADPRQMQFWDDETGAMWWELSDLIMVTLLDGVAEGVDTLPSDVRVLSDWNLVNAQALNFARDYRYNWITKINDTTRVQVQQAITDWIQEGAPLSVLEINLTPIFGRARAEMIAATETTRVFSQGNQIAWESTDVVNKVRWETVVDDRICPICRPLQGTEIGIGDVDAMPPAHVRCRCYTRPVVDDDAFARKLARIGSV